MMMNFKYYYGQAIVRNKDDLEEMIMAAWVAYKHNYKIEI